MAVDVHAANIHDTVGGCRVFEDAYDKYPSIEGVCGDEGYRKTFEMLVLSLCLRIDISKKIKPEWHIIPKRWRVERTFSWMNHDRRLSKDYEILQNPKNPLSLYLIFALCLEDSLKFPKIHQDRF